MKNHKLAHLILVATSACGISLGAHGADSAALGPVTNGLSAYFSFEGNAQDLSGGENHGAPSAQNISYVEGLRGGLALRVTGDNSLFFSGGGHVLLPTFNGKSFTAFTASFWARDEGIGGSPVNHESYLSFGALNHTRLEVALNSVTSKVHFVADSGTGAGFEDGPVISIPDFSSKWKHLVIVYDGQRVRGFVDGKLELDRAAEYPLFPVSFAAIGRHWWDGGGSSSARMSFTMDNLRLFNRALDAAEISKVYAFDLNGADQDRDGLTDDEESFTYNTSPTDADSDDDGLNDGDEVKVHRTNPLRADSDGDGYTDSTEIFAGKDPRDANSHPAATLGVFAAIELEFFTQTGKQYVIESSSDLAAWSTFEGPIAGDGKVWKKTFSARETETRFYRVVLAP